MPAGACAPAATRHPPSQAQAPAASAPRVWRLHTTSCTPPTCAPPPCSAACAHHLHVLWLQPLRSQLRRASPSSPGRSPGQEHPCDGRSPPLRACPTPVPRSNMSPQVGKGFNRDYWARFEKFVKDLIKVADEVLVATGPLYLPAKGANGGWQAQHQLIGETGGLRLAAYRRQAAPSPPPPTHTQAHPSLDQQSARGPPAAGAVLLLRHHGSPTLTPPPARPLQAPRRGSWPCPPTSTRWCWRTPAAGRTAAGRASRWAPLCCPTRPSPPTPPSARSWCRWSSWRTP
jgi:hypothetical protein